jgi:hypothetical protein
MALDRCEPDFRMTLAAPCRHQVLMNPLGGLFECQGFLSPQGVGISPGARYFSEPMRCLARFTQGHKRCRPYAEVAAPTVH